MIDKLRDFNIIAAIDKGSGLTINFNPNLLNIVVTKSQCKSHPNELSKLQDLLNNQKEFEWKITLVE